MKSRKLQERLMLQRISKIDDFVCNQTAEVETKEKSCMADAMEASRIQNQRKQDAMDRGKRKKACCVGGSRKGQEAQKKHQSASEIQYHAYESLDDSIKDSYLLYAYNQAGYHSIIGKDIKPGSYGGDITNGEFGTKA